MQKKFSYLLALLLTAILVVGCNTEEKPDKPEADKNEPSGEVSEQPETDDNPADEVVDDNVSNTDGSDNTSDSTQKDDNTKVPTKDVNYSQNGVEKTEKATETKSVDQSYKLHQLPDFTLVQEEPGKDMLVSNLDDDVFMRIQTLSPEDSGFEDANKSLEVYMGAVGETTPLPAEQLAVFKDASKVEGLKVDFDTEHVIGVALEQDGVVVFLVIHDNDEQDLTSAMLAMAATISKK
ncbi:MAG: hypothetical protein RR651_09760 [Lysinibacillus sp.]